MLASIPAGHIRYTLGAAASELASPGTELLILNDVQRVLESSYRWAWLEARSGPLSLRKNEPYVELPSDFREIISLQPVNNLLDRVMLTTRATVSELRTDGLAGLGTHWAYVDNTPPKVVNLLGFVEELDNAAWTSVATVTADQAVSPQGEASAKADAVVQASATTDSTLQAVVAANLTNGHDYIFSVYVKQHSSAEATTSAIEIKQRGVGGGVSSTAAPKTVGTLTWTAGVPTISATTSQGDGIHTVGVESVGDSWYRVFVGLTWDANPAYPSTDISCAIYPETTDTAAQGIYAWGAQLESIELPDSLVPTRYDSTPAAAAASTLAQVPERRLSIWPTPTATEHSVFILHYRRKLATLTAETDEIAIPGFMEPFFNELSRAYAKGIHEEDEMSLDARLEPLLHGPLYMNAKEQDDTSQTMFGPMRGTAAGTLIGYRNWNNQSSIPNS